MTQSPEKSKHKGRRAIRSYTLTLYPNPGKAEDTRYAMWWSRQYTIDYVRQLYGQPGISFESTAGLGFLANQAQKRARDILRAGRAGRKDDGAAF